MTQPEQTKAEELTGPVLNTDREIWRERPDDFYADSIFVTEGGGIGIRCGGLCIVKPVREWHKLATENNSEAIQRVRRDAAEGDEKTYYGAVYFVLRNRTEENWGPKELTMDVAMRLP